MENNFDKYFKEKLENRKFEMKPEYWEGAEALIEADERGGRWRKFMIFFGMALLVGTVGFFVWEKNNSSVTSMVEENPSFNNVETLLQKEVNNIKNNNSGISKNENVNQNSEDTQNGFSNITDSNTESKNNQDSKKEFLQNQNQNQKAKRLSKKEEIKTKSSKDNGIKSTLSGSGSFAQTIPNNNLASTRVAEISTIALPPNSSDDDKNGINNNSDAEEISSGINGTKPLNGFDLKENNSIESTLKKEESNTKIDASSKKKLNDTEEIDKKVVKEENLNVAFISPLDVFLLSKIEKDFEVEATCFPYYQKSKFRFGGTLGAVGYPLIENSSEDPFIGFKGGFLAEYNLNSKFSRKKWTVGTELLYHFRSGNFVATREAAVIEYSFGRTSTEAKLTPKNLHYLEMPIYLKYHLNKVSFEAGGLVSYLLGVRGEINQNDEIKKGWVTNLGFKKIHTNAIFGVQYSLNNKTKLGLRVNYSLNSILDKNAVLPNGEALRESGPMYLTFKFSQYLK